MPEARLYRTSPFSIFSSRADVMTSLRSSLRPIWTISSAGISRGVRPMSSSPAYRSFRFTRTSWTSIAVKPRLWMSSIPSRSVRPLQDRGMPEGPKRITRSPNGGRPPFDYYSVSPDISTFAGRRLRRGGLGRRRPGRALHVPTKTRWLFAFSEILRRKPRTGKRAPQMFKLVRSLATVTEALFMAKTSKTNPYLQRVVAELRDVSREAGAKVWRDVADRLERSRKNWSEVNLSRLSRYAAKGEQIVVPGVVLATGEISTPITVAAFRASGAARKKIEAAGGKAVSLLELAVLNPKGSGLRLMG